MAARQPSRFERELATFIPPPRSIDYMGSYYWPATREWFAIGRDSPSVWIVQVPTRGIARHLLALAADENSVCDHPWTFGECQNYLNFETSIENNSDYSAAKKETLLRLLRRSRKRDVRRRNGEEDSDDESEEEAGRDRNSVIPRVVHQADDGLSLQESDEEEEHDDDEDSSDANDNAPVSPTSALSDSSINFNGTDQSTLSNIDVAPARTQDPQDPSPQSQPTVLPSAEQVPRGERLTSAVNLWRGMSVAADRAGSIARATPLRPSFSPLTTTGREHSTDG